jgi:hypothetical protein
MTTLDDHTARLTLELLARIRSQVDAFARQLRYRPNLGRIHADVDCRLFESGLIVSTWIEADTQTGAVLTWWMDLLCKDDDWVLDGRLSWNGRDIIVQFPEEDLPHFQAVSERFRSALDALFDAGVHVLDEQQRLTGSLSLEEGMHDL